MSWLGNSFSSLAGQLNTFTSEVLSEGREETSDHEAEKGVLQQHIRELKAFLRSQSQEVEHLKKANIELDDRAKSAEFQVKTLTSEYRIRLQAKEEEIKALRLKNQELEESVDKVKLPNIAEDYYNNETIIQSPNVQLKALEDLNDIISCQCEINKLHEAVRRLQADRDHWKHLSAHTQHSYSSSSPRTVDSPVDLHGLLSLPAESSKDCSQQVFERTSDDHGDYKQSKIHVLQNELHLFQEKIEEQNHMITNLRSELENLQTEKSKVDAAFQNVQVENDIVKNAITVLHDSEHHLQHNLTSARDMLQQQSVQDDQMFKDNLIAAESKISELLHDREQISCDLFATKHRLLAQLHSSHASNAELLRDLCLVRQKFNSEITATQSDLDNQKEKIICALEETNKEHEGIRSRINELMVDQEAAGKESQIIVQNLGTPDQQELVAGAIHALDIENKVLKQTNDDLHKQLVILKEDGKICMLEAVDFQFKDNNNCLESLLADAITPNSTVLPVELTLSECNNTDDHKEQVKQLKGLKESLSESSTSDKDISDLKSVDENDRHLEFDENTCGSFYEAETSRSSALLVEELEALKQELVLTNEKFATVKREDGIEKRRLSQSLSAVYAVKDELEKELEMARQNIKTLQAEIKQIKCDQIQSLWKTEPWVDISEGLDTNKENLNMELQDLELDSLSSKCSKEGKSDDSLKNYEKKDHDKICTTLKKNDSFVNIDSSEIKNSDDGSELISSDKSSSDGSMDKVHVEVQTEELVETVLFGNFLGVLETISMSINAEMDRSLQNLESLVFSFKMFLEHVNGDLMTASINQDEIDKSEDEHKSDESVFNDFNELHCFELSLSNLKILCGKNKSLQRLLKELQQQSALCSNVGPMITKQRNMFLSKDKKIQILEKNAEVMEQEIQKGRQQINALNDILRVYKENLGPEKSCYSSVQESTNKQSDTIQKLEQEKQQMLLVLNEKSQENATLKSEVHRLMSIVSSERVKPMAADNFSTTKNDDDIQEMKEKTVQNLAQIIKTKDEELEAIRQKNETLTTILQKSSVDDERVHLILQDYDKLKQQLNFLNAEREQIVAALTQKHEESLMYHSEIQRLMGVLNAKNQTLETIGQELLLKQGLLTEKERELVIVKDELAQLKNNSHLEDSKHARNAEKEYSEKGFILTRQGSVSCIVINKKTLQFVSDDELEKIDSMCNFGIKYMFIPFQKDQLRSVEKQNKHVLEEFSKLFEELGSEKLTKEMRNTKLQLISQQLMRDDVLFNVSIIGNHFEDHMRQLQNEVERLRNHLIEIEEFHTQEAIEMEKREKELRTRLAAAEELNLSSHSNVNLYVDHSQESENQISVIKEEKRMILRKLDAAENQIQHLTTSMHTLQMVLERFQQEKENEIAKLTGDHKMKLLQEKEVVLHCQHHISQLQQQLDDTAEALEAASRISEKLDNKEELIAALKQSNSEREATIHAMQVEIDMMMISSDGKIDRSIIKNLIINYFIVHQNQKAQVLHLMGTLLDFNHEERIKVGLEKDVKTWIPQWFSGKPAISAAPQGHSQSLSSAFVQFLEKESQPVLAMKLPAQTMMKDLVHRTENRSSKRNIMLGSLAVGSDGNHLTSPHLKMITSALPIFTPAVSAKSGPVARNVLKDVI